jgi:hypothetical protein
MSLFAKSIFRAEHFTGMKQILAVIARKRNYLEEHCK